jgi:hypothetical protein
MIRGSIAVATKIRPESGAAATMIVNGLPGCETVLTKTLGAAKIAAKIHWTFCSGAGKFLKE